MIGLGLSLTTRAVLGLSFNPATLFAAGEQGILIDPSDLSTLFTDAAGTTPVTAPGQTVARVNDKSGRGNHLTQSVAAARPIYGRHPASGVRNLLTATEDFGDAVWAKFNLAVTGNATTAPDGSLTADLITATNTVAPEMRGPSFGGASYPGGDNTFSVWLKSGTNDALAGQITIRNLNDGINAVAIDVDLADGSFIYRNGSSGGSVIPGPDGWWRVAVTVNIPAGKVYRASFGGLGTIPSWSSLYAWGAQLEPGSTATPYQRVGAPSGLAFPQPQSYDITEAGVPNLHYLFCDGLARWMVSPTITPGTDKVQTWAGVRKLSDASRGTIASFSPDITANNGAFALTAPAGASATFSFESKGTTLTDAVGTFAAPTTRVVAGLGDIAGDRSTLRVNGAQVDQDTGDQGTGNYLAYQLFLGARGGTANYLNGLVYSFVARFGPNLPDATIQQVERWTAQRTGVTLP